MAAIAVTSGATRLCVDRIRECAPQPTDPDWLVWLSRQVSSFRCVTSTSTAQKTLRNSSISKHRSSPYHTPRRPCPIGRRALLGTNQPPLPQCRKAATRPSQPLFSAVSTHRVELPASLPRSLPVNMCHYRIENIHPACGHLIYCSWRIKICRSRCRKEKFGGRKLAYNVPCATEGCLWYNRICRR